MMKCDPIPNPIPNRQGNPAKGAASWFGLAVLLASGLDPAAANIDPAQDINAVIPLKPSEPMGQFPAQDDDERLAPHYTFTVDVQITEQEQLGNVTWVRSGPVTATTTTPDPNLFWTGVANTNIYHLTNTATITGLATLEVKCVWRPQGGGGGGQGPAGKIDGRADSVIDLLDSVVHWDFGKTIAPADGEQSLTFSYMLLDEAGRGLERWESSAYTPEDPDPGHVAWHFVENPGSAEWEREVEVDSWGDAARAGIRLDYHDGSLSSDVSEDHLTFFTAELKVTADGVADAEQVTLGKPLKLTAEFVPTDLDPDRIRYASSFRHEHNFHVLHDSDDDDVFEHHDFARIAGFFNLRLTLHYHNGISVAVHTSDTEELEVQFPSYHEIVAEGPTTDFERKWGDTLTAATPQNWREYGGWILYDSVTLQYSMSPREGEVVDLETDPKIDHAGDRPDAVPHESTLNPASPGANYAVGFFHTHPPFTHRPDNQFREAGSHQDDDDWHDAHDISGVIYAYVPTHNEVGQPVPPFILIQGGHEMDDDTSLYPSGPERRSTFEPEPQ